MEDFIVITGYGQFMGHEVNASAEAVKLLPKNIEIGKKKFDIKVIHINVEYEDVDSKIEQIWKMQPQPHLVLHCGEDKKMKLKFDEC